MTSESKFKSLQSRFKFPTPKPLIKKRKGPGGKELDYVEWYNHAEALDELCEDFWYAEVLNIVQAGNNVCVAVRLYVDGFHFDNVGSESTNHTDPAAAAFAQAFKRDVAMALGFTRDLYRLQDDKSGLWTTIEADRKKAIAEITSMLPKADVTDSDRKSVQELIDTNGLHYNAAITVQRFLKRAGEKPSSAGKAPKVKEKS